MLRSMMYVTTPSGCSLRRTASASMPIPIRSSDRNISNACCLLNDTVDSPAMILAELTVALQISVETKCPPGNYEDTGKIVGCSSHRRPQPVDFHLCGGYSIASCSCYPFARCLPHGRPASPSPISPILIERHYGSNESERDQRIQRRPIVLVEECDDSISVNGPHTGHHSEANTPACRNCSDELLAVILQRSRR